jgi:hypothetical protein
LRLVSVVLSVLICDLITIISVGAVEIIRVCHWMGPSLHSFKSTRDLWVKISQHGSLLVLTQISLSRTAYLPVLEAAKNTNIASSLVMFSIGGVLEGRCYQDQGIARCCMEGRVLRTRLQRPSTLFLRTATPSFQLWSPA